MDITMLPPSTILSHHSHLSLLPSHIPNTDLRSTSNRRRYSPTLQSSYSPRHRRYHEPVAPRDGSSPISSLPDEIIVSILSWLEWDEILSLQSVNKRWRELSTAQCLFQSLTFLSLPPNPLPETVESVLMRSVRYLHLHLFPYPTRSMGHPTSTLINLLNAIPPHQLRSLSLPFSAPYLPGAELGVILSRIGGVLENLDLRGSGLVGNRWIQWLDHIGKDGEGLRNLDLGFTSISSLPILQHQLDPRTGIPSTPSIPVFRNLRTLSLASCTYLPEGVVIDFLVNLPTTVEKLDISRLESVTFGALWDMRVVHRVTDSIDEYQPTALSEIKVVGIDHLTRLDVRRLKAHWEEQRRQTQPPEMEIEDLSPAFIPIKSSSWAPRTPPQTYAPLSPPITPESGHHKSHILRQLSPSPPMPTHPFFQSLPTPPSSLRSLTPVYEPTPYSINIVHSAILESEDEAGYRQFIGEVVGSTLVNGLGNTGLALGWGDNAPQQRGLTRNPGGWIEVDGGMM